MSHAPAWEPSYPSTQHPHHDDDSDEDVKAPYDDLIDQYATPFSQNSQHKVHKVEPLAFDQKTNATGKDLEGASSDGHDWAYPPAPTANEKGQRKPLTWSTVCANPPCRFVVAKSELTRAAVHPRLHCLSAVPPHRPHRDCDRFGNRGRPLDPFA